MPLNLPNLDDRNYRDLVEEAMALLPIHAPDWTNHNPSDPGITLVEMLAYLTEMLIYRVNRVTDANYLAFLKLLKGPKWTSSPEVPLAQQLRDAVLELRKPDRAVTSEDFERLAREADPTAVARVRCLPRRNLDLKDSRASSAEKPGHVSVIIVPDNAAINPQPDDALLAKVQAYLEPRRLLTTRVHVAGPRYVAFGVRLTLHLKLDAVDDQYLFSPEAALQAALQIDLDSQSVTARLQQVFESQHQSLSLTAVIVILVANEDNKVWLINGSLPDECYVVRKEGGALNVYQAVAQAMAITALKEFFDPLHGGEEGNGWPFGRSVFVSEIYQLLDQLPGIDYVAKTVGPHEKELDELFELEPIADPRLVKSGDDLVSLALAADELIDVSQLKFDLTINTA